jgi:hypothetical protein
VMHLCKDEDDLTRSMIDADGDSIMVGECGELAFHRISEEVKSIYRQSLSSAC